MTGTLKTNELYCSRGHLLVRGGRIVCGASGHTHDDREIDLEALIANAVAAGMFDVQKFGSLLLNINVKPDDKNVIYWKKPPRHEAKLLFELEPSHFPGDSHVIGAGIGWNGRAWVVSGWVGDDIRKLPLEPHPESVGMRIRFENSIFVGGPYADVGCVLTTKNFYSFVYHTADGFFHGKTITVPTSEVGDMEFRDFAIDESRLPEEHTEGLWNLNYDVPVLQYDVDLLKLLVNDLPNGREPEEWIMASRSEVAHSNSLRGLWRFSRGVEDDTDPRVSIGTNWGRTWVYGSAWDHIHAVRVITGLGPQKMVVYVAQRGDKVYKVSVPLPFNPQ